MLSKLKRLKMKVEIEGRITGQEAFQPRIKLEPRECFNVVNYFIGANIRSFKIRNYLMNLLKNYFKIVSLNCQWLLLIGYY